MKRTHKKVFGLFGLVLVAIVTVFAAFLPSPGTLAADSGSFTDNISVRVTGAAPSIDVDGIEQDSVSPDGRRTATIPYSGVESIVVKIKYTDESGNEHVTTLPRKYVNYETGTATLDFDTLTGEYYLDGEGGSMVAYGYGDYEVEVEGFIGDSVVAGPIYVDFETSPIGDGTQVVKEEGEGGDKYYLDVDYDASGEIPGGADVDRIGVRVFNENGEEVTAPLTIVAPDTRIELPFAEWGDGKYRIELTAYDANGNVIYKSPAYVLEYTYSSGDKPLPVPGTGDTGGVMGNLNISKTDYIITGLIIFGIIGISAAVFISKHDKKVSGRRK